MQILQQITAALTTVVMSLSAQIGSLSQTINPSSQSAQVLGASTISVSVVGTTNTQAVLKYTAPDAGSCRLEISESPSYASPVHDVNPALFAGADMDNRTGSLSDSASRIVVIGKRLTEKALDTKNYSRALQANTAHYYRVTCGEAVGAGSFTTQNIPFGNTYTDFLQADSNTAGGYLWPSVSATAPTPIIDQYTGALFKPLAQASDVALSGYVLGNTSGGFGEFCNPQISANGFYHCLIPASGYYNWAPGLYGINPVTGESRFLGTVYYWGQGYGLRSGVRGCMSNNSAAVMWDTGNANVLYCDGSFPDGKPAIVKITLTGNDQPVTTGAEGSNPPRASYSLDVLTLESGNDFVSQLKAVNPQFDSTKFNCGFRAYQAGHLIFSCRRYQQDSFAWIGAYDLGNKLPLSSGGNGKVGALIKMWEQPNSRWCTEHSYEYMGDVPISSWATQSIKGSDSYKITLVNSMPVAAAGSLTQVQVTSTWDQAWGEAPAGYQPGEPLSPSTASYRDHFLSTLEPGDILSSNGEYMRVAQKISPTELVLERGLMQKLGSTPKAQVAGAALSLYCNAGSPPDVSYQQGSTDLPYLWWDFVNNPTGQDQARYKANFGSHPVARGNYRINPYAIRVGAITDPNTWGMSNLTFGISQSPTFAGAKAPADGNYFQKHVSMPLSAPAWFLDVLPYIGGNIGTRQDSSATKSLGGNLYQYFYNGLDYDGLNRKQFSTLAFSGNNILTDVSGPNSVINDSKPYSYCVANKAGECVSGSLPGNIYFDSPGLTIPYCSGGETYSGANDICIADMPTIGISVSQFKIMNDTAGQAIRPIIKSFGWRNWSSTSNTKPLPDGSWTIFYAPNPPPSNVLLAKIPPITPSDGIDRSTFLRVPLNLTPPTGKGITKAIVEFGYMENGSPLSYYCTSRQEPCVSVSSSISDPDPFKYEITESFSPVSCATSCSIAIPVLPERVAYYKVKYLDNANNQVAEEKGVATELNSASINNISISQPTKSPTVGDFNGDSLVNSLDLSLMASAWNTSNVAYDLNRDSLVNSLDYTLMVQNWTP